jgi:predicted alpha/beta-fold hydrolase
MAVVGKALRRARGVSPDGAEPMFLPHPLVRHPLAQTTLAARTPPRTRRVRATEMPVIVDGGKDYTGRADGVRLLAYLNRGWGGERRGLIILLHGWEGCSHSVYNLVMADAWLRAGYDVARINLRDHGPNLHVDAHALNPGIFLGTLIEESHRAVQELAHLAGDGAVYLVGSSMGGNFVLRMAVRAAEYPVPNLRRVVAISPAVDPAGATRCIDRHPVFHAYFRTRWARSLARKQHLFPELYDFRPALAIRSVWEMTEWLVQHYTPMTGATEYFRRYQVDRERLAGLATPTTVIAAEDDPVIPIDSIRSLGPHAALTLEIFPYGGHVGFVEMPLRRRLPDLVLSQLG